MILAVVVQTGGGFLSGSRKDATLEDPEDCYGRATIALTRAIHLTYILSPVDMAGWPGMAQVLAVYHIGFVKLQDRTSSDHMKPSVPSDAAAVLAWSLQSPFRATDGPPLALTKTISALSALSALSAVPELVLPLSKCSRLCVWLRCG